MNKKYVVCFSNGTEAMYWQENNCYICNRKPCSARLSIEKGFVSGHISWNMAKFIGFKSCNNSNIMTEDDYCELNNKCDHFNKPNIKKKKAKSSLNLPSLFNCLRYD
jgi:hypothetical protein